MLQVDALSEEKAGLLSQLAELQRVGEELSRSCSQLETSLQQASAFSSSTLIEPSLVFLVLDFSVNGSCCDPPLYFFDQQ